MLTDAYLCLLMLSDIFITRSLSIFILSTKHFYTYRNFILLDKRVIMKFVTSAEVTIISDLYCCLIYEWTMISTRNICIYYA